MLADRMTRGTGHELAFGVQRIRSGQLRGGDPFSRVYVRNQLISGQGRTDEKGTTIVAEVFRLVRPRTDEQAEIETRRHHVFVKIQRGKTVWRIPAAAVALRVVGI